MNISRRTFIAGTSAAGALSILPRGNVQAAIKRDSYATLIDLHKCDGCVGKSEPLCVASCRQGRKKDFPQPAKEQLQDYWPQKNHEDWSGKKHLTNRLTPYNWIFLQQVKVGERTISIPRRCMHCDNPPCAKLCPFGVKHKTPEGPVYIDHSLCFGGAKCRTVCPWSVPQRQAGLGIYTLWQKYLPVGGGVMYKCDLCRDRLSQGMTPHCIEACPQKAMLIGQRDAIMAKANELRELYNGDIYGMAENGGTSTVYVSPLPFAEIDQALEVQAQKRNTKNTMHLHHADNMLEKQNTLAALSLFSPAIGVVAAIALSSKDSAKGGKE